MNQCGAHPVVYLDLKEGADTISSFEDAVRAMKISLQNAYLRHPYLTTSPMLSTEDKKLLALWNPVNFPSLDIAHVEVGLLSLCRLVSKHFSKKCFLLVDEYDAICTSAFSVVNADVLNNIMDFYAGIVGSVVKLNHEYVERSVLTGITRIMSTGLSSAINNIVPFPFMEKEKFIDYYGILDWEFSELLSRNCNSSIHHIEHEAFDYYNGYTAFGRKILNTWSVMNFLEEGILQPYWVLSGVLSLKLEKIYEKPLVQQVIHKLICDEEVEVQTVEFNARNLRKFLDDFENSEKKLTNTDPLLYYYLQQGYLSVSNRFQNGFIFTVKIPNIEVKYVFKSAILTFFEELFNVERKLVDTCANLFERFNIIDDDNSCQEILLSVCKILEIICNDSPYHELINEWTLEHFIFSMLYLARFHPVSQNRVDQIGHYYKQYDSCAFRGDQGIIIELKVDQTAKEAIHQILENNYIQGLFDFSSVIKQELKNFVLIGINLKKINVKEGVEVKIRYKITACYLCNSVNPDNVKYVL